MHKTTKRKLAVRLTAVTGIVTLAALTAATPTNLDPANAYGAVGFPKEYRRGVDAAETIAATAQAAPNGGISVDRIGAGVLTVNRVRKGDLPVTRRAAERPEIVVPASGSVWEMEDVFSAYEDGALPKVAFVARDPLPAADLLVAYSHFSKPTSVLDTAPETMVASLPRPRGEPTAFGTKRASDSAVLAYAPQGAGLDAPFDALLNETGPELGAADDRPLVPRARPGKATLASWLAGRSLFQFGPNQHDWAANPLPQSVFSVKEQKCLAEAVYFEARGEPELGQAAVAQVVLNRVRNPAYPDSICGVVYQQQNRRNSCQFSFACDGIPERITSASAFAIAQRVARDVSDGNTWLRDVGDSTHYHANYVRPRWAKSMKKVDKIGDHIFYRTRFGGWS